MSAKFYSEEQLKFIKAKRENGISWEDVSDDFNKTFGDTKSSTAIRKTFARYEEDLVVETLKSKQSIEKKNKVLTATNKLMVSSQMTLDLLLVKITELVSSGKFAKVQLPKITKTPNKKNMTMEVLFSDIHIGKKSKTFNKEIARKRVQDFTHRILQEYERHSKFFNVEQFVIAMLGDNIENSIMHGSESLAGCEFENSEQVQTCIDIFFNDLILPIALTGQKVVIPCVTGNHDRPNINKTYNYPGTAHLSWIIYNTLKLLCEKMGLKNVSFIIPDGTSCTHKIYNDLVLYEHGDHVSKFTESALESHVDKRGRQLGQIITFFRLGHIHKHMSYNRGKIVVNGSICGQDSYATIKGYHGDASQTINFYVETEDRPDSFYHSFPIYLG